MFSFVVAFDANKGIGLNGGLPWHIKEDLQLFKKNTLFHKIVMGSTTFDKLPRKLKDRTMFVVSKKENYQPEDCTVIHDFSAFLKDHEDDEEEYIICGGSSIYKQAYPFCKKAYVSFVKNSYEVDTYFEGFDVNDWNVEEEIEFSDFTYRLLIRK